MHKRRGNQHKIRLELWTDDALGESGWVVWSSGTTAPSRKPTLRFRFRLSEASLPMGKTLVVFAFYLKKNHLHQTRTEGH